MREVVILSSVRTAGGAFGGSLKNMSVVDLGVHAARGAAARASRPSISTKPSSATAGRRPWVRIRRG